mmetsp:Transcript_2991/g.4086  ORF Transcript_2991/g.4086 Transcript_2991/m.4086 type:complete len:80 (+) Transcript_2991:52-291(+)
MDRTSASHILCLYAEKFFTITCTRLPKSVFMLHSCFPRKENSDLVFSSCGPQTSRIVGNIFQGFGVKIICNTSNTLVFL